MNIDEYFLQTLNHVLKTTNTYEIIQKMMSHPDNPDTILDDHGLANPDSIRNPKTICIREWQSELHNLADYP